jgi:hypothetical protein
MYNLRHCVWVLGIRNPCAHQGGIKPPLAYRGELWHSSGRDLAATTFPVFHNLGEKAAEIRSSQAPGPSDHSPLLFAVSLGYIFVTSHALTNGY